MDLIYRGNEEEKVCLQFYPCLNYGEDITWEQWHVKDPLTIYKSDYRELLLKYLNDMFPVVDPTNGQEQEEFDVCFDNWIGKSHWINLIEQIKKDFDLSQSTPVNDFYNQFIKWLEEQLEWAEIIMVDGNQ